MSTSHYARTDYTSPSRTDDYPEPGMDIKTVIPDWQDPLSHPSLAHSRPAACDVGADTLRLSHAVPSNTRRVRRSPLVAAVSLLAAGVGLLILDGCALVNYADEVTESTVIALVALPTALFVTATAFVIRGMRR